MINVNVDKIFYYFDIHIFHIDFYEKDEKYTIPIIEKDFDEMIGIINYYLKEDKNYIMISDPNDCILKLNFINQNKLLDLKRMIKNHKN